MGTTAAAVRNPQGGPDLYLHRRVSQRPVTLLAVLNGGVEAHPRHDGEHLTIDVPDIYPPPPTRYSHAHTLSGVLG